MKQQQQPVMANAGQCPMLLHVSRQQLDKLMAAALFSQALFC